MIGYKVVCRNNNKLYSAVFINKFSKEYKINKFVRSSHTLERKGYGLTFFDSMQQAKHFISLNDNVMERFFNKGKISSPNCLEIWKIESSGVMKKLPKLRRIGFVDFPPKTLYEIYNTNNIKCAFDWPYGTKMARKIKLVKRIF